MNKDISVPFKIFGVEVIKMYAEYYQSLISYNLDPENV